MAFNLPNSRQTLSSPFFVELNNQLLNQFKHLLRVFLFLDSSRKFAPVCSGGFLAEGVENLEQLRKLRTARCDCAQGFLFSYPLFAEAVHAVLATGRTAPSASATSRAAASASH
jgi:EAL domain-containing protein (putative c-di-GMP-specific phosphodiesterase class I)